MYNSLALPSISKKVGTRCPSPSYERFLEGCSSPFMRLAEHLTALRAWCKQCLPGWWKSDVLRPGGVGMRGSMVIRLRPCTNWAHAPLFLQSFNILCRFMKTKMAKCTSAVRSSVKKVFIQNSALQAACDTSIGRCYVTGGYFKWNAKTKRRRIVVKLRCAKPTTGLTKRFFSRR